jgi:hypothetical protein
MHVADQQGIRLALALSGAARDFSTAEFASGDEHAAADEIPTMRSQLSGFAQLANQRMSAKAKWCFRAQLPVDLFIIETCVNAFADGPTDIVAGLQSVDNILQTREDCRIPTLEIFCIAEIS